MKNDSNDTNVSNRSISVAARVGAGQRPSAPAPAMTPSGGAANANHARLTRSGKPDRRFLGQRDLPAEEIVSDYTVPSTGFIDSEGRHRTQDGAPDVRFKENRSLSADQVRIMQAQWVLSQGNATK